MIAENTNRCVWIGIGIEIQKETLFFEQCQKLNARSRTLNLKIPKKDLKNMKKVLEYKKLVRLI